MACGFSCGMGMGMGRPGYSTAEERRAAGDDNDSHAIVPGRRVQLFQKHGNELLREGVSLGGSV